MSIELTGMIVVAAALAGINYLGRSKKIGEARFDGNGKIIEDE